MRAIINSTHPSHELSVINNEISEAELMRVDDERSLTECEDSDSKVEDQWDPVTHGDAE